MGIIADRLKEARKRSGLSQRQAAEKLNISQSSVSLHEKEERNLFAETLDSYANLYGVSVEWLLGKTNDPSPTSLTKEEIKDYQELIFKGKKMIDAGEHPTFRGKKITKRMLEQLELILEGFTLDEEKNEKRDDH